MSEHQPATLLAQADHFIHQETGAITPPIYNSSTFARDEQYEIRPAGAKYSLHAQPEDAQEPIYARDQALAHAR